MTQIRPLRDVRRAVGRLAGRDTQDDGRGSGDADGALADAAAAAVAEVFDLAAGPLFRAHLHRLGDARQVLQQLRQKLIDGWRPESEAEEILKMLIAD